VGDLRTAEVATLVEPDGVPALGMKHDARSNLLFVARSSSGAGTVFDAASGEVVAQYSFQTAPTFVNDVVVTREAAYFTDTQAPFLYRVELGPAGEPAADATQVPLPSTFRTNGIAATRNGEHLCVVDGSTAQLYRLDS
jgi:sugar lactone lactonase YvrE